MDKFKLTELGITYASKIMQSTYQCREQRNECYDPDSMDCLSDPFGCDSDCDCEGMQFDCIADSTGCDSDCDCGS